MQGNLQGVVEWFHEFHVNDPFVGCLGLQASINVHSGSNGTPAEHLER